MKGANLLKIRLIQMCESSKPSEDTTYPKAKETVISLVLVFQCPVQRIGSPQDELLKLFYSNSKHKSLKHKSKGCRIAVLGTAQSVARATKSKTTSLSHQNSNKQNCVCMWCVCCVWCVCVCVCVCVCECVCVCVCVIVIQVYS